MRNARGRHWQPDLRASDADRDRVAAYLRDHCSEGRLSPDELSERVGRVYAARTLWQLEALVRDLPGWPFPKSPPVRSAARLRPKRRSRRVTYGVLALLLAAMLAGLASAVVWTAFAMAVAVVAILLSLAVALAPLAMIAVGAIWALRRSRRPVPPWPAGLR
jgi:Domain of unknown function (DUF1707)